MMTIARYSIKNKENDPMGQNKPKLHVQKLIQRSKKAQKKRMAGKKGLSMNLSVHYATFSRPKKKSKKPSQDTRKDNANFPRMISQTFSSKILQQDEPQVNVSHEVRRA